MFTETIVRVRAPLAPDRHRNPVRQWAHATRQPIAGVNVQPQTRTESGPGGNREQTTSTWAVRSAPGEDLDLLSTDRVELPTGELTEVTGDVARWNDSLTGAVHHAEATLQLVKG